MKPIDKLQILSKTFIKDVDIIKKVIGTEYVLYSKSFVVKGTKLMRWSNSGWIPISFPLKKNLYICLE